MCRYFTRFGSGCMDETDEVCALDVWRDIDLSSNGLWLGNLYEPSSAKLDVELHSGGDIGFHNDDARGTEDSELGFYEKVGKSGDEISAEVGAGFGGASSAGTIAERRAAKFGLNAPSIDTHIVRSCNSLASSPRVRSPYLTIPPGISPDALLDSPIMLPNSQPSPTTGTFSVPDSTSVDSAFQSACEAEGRASGSSIRSPQSNSVSLACIPGLTNQIYPANDMDQAKGAEHDGSTRTLLQSQVKIEFAAQFPSKGSPKNYDTCSLADIKVSNDMAVNFNSSALPICDPCIASGCDMSPDNELFQEEEATECDSADPVRKGKFPAVESITISDDGYNWRKYGQKQVKGSEYPRSYYKCTHPNCPVKKKIERSYDGQITEIIYKGVHCHPKPQLNRRSTFGSLLSFTELSEVSESTGFCLNTDDSSVGRTAQYHSEDVKVGTDLRIDGLEKASSISGITEVSDPFTIPQGNLLGVLESTGNPEHSSTMVIQEVKEEDAATLSQGSILLGDDEDKEPDSKRRRTEGSFIEATLSSRGVREPRVVVQIESDIDILDDGYRWRKYGQKVVKGNPNPRSYYKCTSAGCTVRKHVERASHDLKYVITTYEGKHNHEPPAARNSNQTSASGGNWPPSAPNTTSGLALPRGSHLPKPEPPDLVPQFDRKVEYLGDFLRPTYLGMKIHTLPSTLPYTTYGMNLGDTDPYPSMAPPITDLSIPSPLRLPGPPILTPIDFIRHNRTFVQTCLAGGGESGMEFLRPKQERRDDSL